MRPLSLPSETALEYGLCPLENFRVCGIFARMKYPGSRSHKLKAFPRVADSMHFHESGLFHQRQREQGGRPEDLESAPYITDPTRSQWTPRL
jgi:hypothetical protein